MISIPITGIRKATSGLLLTLMLVVSAAPFLRAIAAATAGCGTHCCRNKKDCCCRRKTAPVGPVAMTASTCPPGCGQAAGAAGPSLTWMFGVATSFPVPLEVLLMGVALLAVAAMQRCFALFGRPPPHCFLPAQ